VCVCVCRYYRECAAALVVYDLSKPETLETAQYWVKELQEKEHPYCVLLIGNKVKCVYSSHYLVVCVFVVSLTWSRRIP
jgi:GTPase SAR1 family protein